MVSHLRDKPVYPHKESSFIEGIGLGNSAPIDPRFGYFSISIVAPAEKEEFNQELNTRIKKNYLVEYPVATMSCGEEDSKVRVSPLNILTTM
jgi:hypothetical protein